MATFGDDRLRGLGVVRDRVSGFPIDFRRSLTTLSHYRASVWYARHNLHVTLVGCVLLSIRLTVGLTLLITQCLVRHTVRLSDRQTHTHTHIETERQKELQSYRDRDAS